jgi:AGCS family alanine or glycine:cation symporter
LKRREPAAHGFGVIMQSLEHILGSLSDLVWGPVMLALLFGTHIFLTFRLRFIQRYIPNLS